MPATTREIETVLAPVDGSDCSFRALDFATTMARTYGADLHAVHVTDERTRATEDLSDRADRLLSAADVEASMDVIVDLDLGDRPSEQIGETVLDLVTERDVDHVVMGHHGQGAVERALIGSAAETVLEAKRVPVTVVP